MRYLHFIQKVAKLLPIFIEPKKGEKVKQTKLGRNCIRVADEHKKRWLIKSHLLN